MKSQTYTFISVLAIVLGSLFQFEIRCAAQDINWINPSGGLFGNALNWDPQLIPGVSNNAIFNLNLPYVVQFDQNHTNDRLFVQAGVVTFNLNGHTYTVTNSSSGVPSVVVGHLSGNVAELRLRNGILNSYSAALGLNAGSTGTVRVGINAQWNLDGELHVGRAGNGTLVVENGGVVESAGARISVGDGMGQATVSGAGSQWNNSGPLFVGIGDAGYGTLNILDQGVVTNSIGYIGFNNDSNGDVVVNGPGSLWNNSGSLYVGYQGDGSLSVENGGGVQSSGLAIIGFDGINGQSSHGHVSVTGTGSHWHNNGILDVGWGQLGQGEIVISNGGVVSNTSATVGSSGHGTAEIAGIGSQWINDGSLVLGQFGFGHMSVSSGGVVTSLAGVLGLQSGGSGSATVTGFGSQWSISQNLTVGQFGSGTLSVGSGGRVENNKGMVGHSSGATGTVSVSGNNSQWNNATDLEIGLGGQGTVNITSGGKVTVGGTTSIGSSGIVNLSGSNSRFEFGQTTLPEFARINATGGSMAGSVSHSGYTHAASLTTLRNPLVNLNEVSVRNFGTLYGDAILDVGLINESNGEVEISAGERLRFFGVHNSNAGEINNFGGQIRFAGSVQNQGSGFIAGRGQFIADGGWNNAGVIALSGGASEVLGDVVNDFDGVIITSGAGTTTFFDDVINQGEIRTSLAVSNSVFLGAVTGAGSFTGAGTVFMEGDLRPGNSPSAVSFGGDLVFGSQASTTFELGGLNWGEFDQLLVAGDLFLNNSELSVALWDEFQLGADMQFLIADVGGSLNGIYGGLGEGALVGNFSGHDLFITYNGFGGQSGIGLYTAVPEPSSGLLMFVFGTAWLAMMRRRVARHSSSDAKLE